MVVVRAGMGEKRSDCLMCIELPLCKVTRSIEMNGVDGFTTLCMYLISLNYTKNYLKLSMLCYIYIYLIKI